VLLQPKSHSAAESNAVDCGNTARSGGWNRSTTSLRVKEWGAFGRLVRTPGSDGRSAFTARTPAVPQACDVVAALASPSAKSLVIPTVSLPVQSAAQGEYPVIGDREGRRIGEDKMHASVGGLRHPPKA